MKLTFIPPSRTAQTILVFLLSIVSFSLNAQQDFNHFQTLVAKGEIPEDFTLSTATKIEQDLVAKRDQIPSAERKKIVESIHYNVDYLLHSGYVIYGDEISLYVQSVAANLLKKEPKLLAQLRFYTVKSTEVNAFSTDQGIIFITTGLISQLTSEAQLAYVLSHEIIHYTEKHLIEDANWDPSSRRLSKKISELYSHSKAHEFEADELALQRYKDAGYSFDEIYSTFDVLMYGYLPFDEVPFRERYYSNDKMFIPESYFTKKEYPITAEEDYDDEFSSHPNIKSRKAAISTVLSKMEEAGNEQFILGKEKFNYVRDLARFESVRCEVLEEHYAKALYNILLLETNYPHSIYLKRLKALSWLGFARLSGLNSTTKAIPSSETFEGESAKMYKFFKQLSEDQFNTIALRIIYDLQKENPDDLMIGEIMDELIHFLVKRTDFSLKQYSTKTFSQNAQLALDPQSAPVEVEKPAESQSKYDKIKAKKTEVASGTSTFDSTNFHLYALSDIVLDSAFQAYFKNVDATTRIKETDQISYTYLNEFVGEFYLDMDRAILIDPNTLYLSQDDKINWKEMEELNQVQKERFLNLANKNSLAVAVLQESDLDSLKTSHYNDLMMLNCYLKQVSNTNLNDCFPVDYDYIISLKDKYKTSKVFFLSTTFIDNRATYKIKLVDLATGKIQVDAIISDTNIPSAFKCTKIYTDLFEKLNNK